MINLNFTNQCTFCNKEFFDIKEYNSITACACVNHTDDNIDFFRSFYSRDDLKQIIMHTKIYRIDVDLLLNNIKILVFGSNNYNPVTISPIPDFNSLHDLLDIVNINMLFT